MVSELVEKYLKVDLAHTGVRSSLREFLTLYWARNHQDGSGTVANFSPCYFVMLLFVLEVFNSFPLSYYLPLALTIALVMLPDSYLSSFLLHGVLSLIK